MGSARPLALALCSAALFGCNVTTATRQGGGGSNASGAIVDVQLKSNTEKQLAMPSPKRRRTG